MTSVTDPLIPEALVPGDGRVLTEDDFARSAGVTRAQLRELQDYGLLPGGRLDMPAALALREAVRLQGDFDLDLFSTGLIAGYIERIQGLQAELGQLRAERCTRTVYTEVSYTSVAVRRAG